MMDDQQLVNDMAALLTKHKIKHAVMVFPNELDETSILTVNTTDTQLRKLGQFLIDTVDEQKPEGKPN